MANLEFQQPEVKEQLQGKEQTEKERTEGYNKCKNQIKALYKMKQVKEEDSDEAPNIQKKCKQELAQIAMKLGDAYGLGLGHNITTLKVNDAGEIEMYYYTSESRKVTIVINETTAVKTTQRVMENNRNVPIGQPESIAKFELQKPNFRNDYLEQYYQNQSRGYAAKGHADRNELAAIEVRLDEAYS